MRYQDESDGGVSIRFELGHRHREQHEEHVRHQVQQGPAQAQERTQQRIGWSMEDGTKARAEESTQQRASLCESMVSFDGFDCSHGHDEDLAVLGVGVAAGAGLGEQHQQQGAADQNRRDVGERQRQGA